MSGPGKPLLVDRGKPAKPVPDTSIPEIGTISRVVLEPGDVLVVEAVTALSPEDVSRICGQISKIWPGHQVVIMDQGTTLKAVSKSA